MLVQVVFNKPKTLKREVTLVNASDINLAIIEPLTTNKEESIPIRVSVRALFSKYAITPARGINFGPLTYNTSSKPRTFEITNLGEFPFNFKLFNFVEPPPPPTPTEGEYAGCIHAWGSDSTAVNNTAAVTARQGWFGHGLDRHKF